MATMGGAKSLGMEDIIGSITPGKKADLLLIKNDESPAMTPILNPYAHVVYQAGTADVHTVVVNGRVVKYEGKRIGLPLAPIARQGRRVRRVRALAARRGARGTRACTPRSSRPRRSRTRTRYTEGDAHVTAASED